MKETWTDTLAEYLYKYTELPKEFDRQQIASQMHGTRLREKEAKKRFFHDLAEYNPALRTKMLDVRKKENRRILNAYLMFMKHFPKWESKLFLEDEKETLVKMYEENIGTLNADISLLLYEWEAKTFTRNGEGK